MVLTYLSQVNIADFIEHIKPLTESFPSFLEEDKKKFAKLFEKMGNNAKQSRLNISLRKTNTDILPKLKKIAKCLALSLEIVDNPTEAEQKMLKALKESFKNPRKRLDITAEATMISMMEVPKDPFAKVAFERFCQQTDLLLETNKETIKEKKRITNIMSANKYRKDIIRQLRITYLRATLMHSDFPDNEEYEKVITSMDKIAKHIKSHLRRRKKRKEKEEELLV